LTKSADRKTIFLSVLFLFWRKYFSDPILKILKKFAVLFRYDLQMHRKSDKGEEVSRNECRRKAVTVDG